MARTVFGFHFLNFLTIFSDQLKVKWICKIFHNIRVFVCWFVLMIVWTIELCNNMEASLINASFSGSHHTPGTPVIHSRPWASCHIRIIEGCECAGNVFPATTVSDPDMRHGTCARHVLWCMPGSLTSCFVGGRAIPVHAQPAILRFW